MSTKLKLISNDGSYLRTKFEFDSSVWTLIGTESIQSQVNTFRLTQEQKTEQLMITTHDTFKSKEVPVQTKAIVRVKNKKSFSVFGSRFFGLGTHKSEISVPPTMIKELAQLTVEQIVEYKNELKQLLGE